MFNAEQDCLSRAAARVQSLPLLPRALLAREALIAAAGSTIAFGPREGRLRKLLALTGRFGLILISLALLAKRYVAARNYSTNGVLPEALFLGIAAMREQAIRQEIGAQLGCELRFVDQRSPEGFAGLPLPRMNQIMRLWATSLREALAITSSPDEDFSRLDLLSTFAMRVHELAYLQAIFSQLFKERPNLRIYSSTADLAAYAACLAGFSVEYRQHGFLARTLVFPKFSSMVALTSFEGRYVAARVPGLTLKLSPQPPASVPISMHFAFVGDYQARHQGPINSLVEEALSQGFTVIVRPHPHGFEGQWSGIKGRKGVVFDTEGKFGDFLARWRPAFLASWFSTTLLDGLTAGAVPITLSPDNSHVVLPIDAIALSWPDEGSRIKACIRDIEERRRVHESLLHGVLQL